ncbi:glucose-6-phosphate isomerase [Thermaurantiacus sp.]
MTTFEPPPEDAARALQQLRALASAPRPSIEALVSAGEGRRAEVCGIHFDWTRLGLEGEVWAALEGLAAVMGVAPWRDAMAAGAIVNPSEGRAATHMALRAPEARDSFRPAFRVAEELRSGPFDHVLHIGIGGSALGPLLLLDALGRDGDGPEVRVVANIDGEALFRATRGLDPARTAIVAVSKTFTTLETLTNLASALDWMRAGGVADPWARVTAVTAAPARAVSAGVSPSAILDFAESVGGRYSLWSAVGLPLMVRAGVPAFESLLDGAAAMDRHFLNAPFATNAPMLAAAADFWFASVLAAPTRAVFAYDERLRLLPSYLQQLEMESNGKSVTRGGKPVPVPTAPILWGGTGTDAQHAVFQLLHQGTHADPVEFVAVARPGHGLAAVHHAQLLANCLAQGRALAAGRSREEALAAAGGDEALAAARTFPGNRPSSTHILDSLTAGRLGALLAFYEARTFCFAAMLGINPFDQWGVELGKEMASALVRKEGRLDPATAALMAFIARAQASAA